MKNRPVMRPGHVSLRVLDLDEALNHYIDFLGLLETGRDDEGRVYLKAWDEHDHHSLILREASSAGMDCMAFKVVNEAALQDVAQALQDYGVEIEHRAAGENLATGERIRFSAPSGHVFELYAQKDMYGNGMPTTDPGIVPKGLKGIHPSRFDHCALTGENVEASYQLFKDVLGFDLAEQVVDGDTMMAAFLSCSNKPHDVAFIFSPGAGKLHHISFFVDSWAQVLYAADLIGQHDVAHEVGPTRHGITRGETMYFFDSSGNRNEVFSGGYIWYPDRPTLTWSAHQIAKAIFYTEGKMTDTFLSVTT